MKGLPSIAVTIIFLMFFLNACQRATKNSDVVVSNQETIEDRCEKECKEYTERHCPMLITDDLILESMYFERSTRAICYNYFVNDNCNKRFDNLDSGQMKNVLINELRETASMKDYIDNGFNFHYIYSSKILDITITKDDL